MTMYYATHYSENGKIDQGADISAFPTEQEARDWLLKAFEGSGLQEDGFEIVIETGSYGDCWIKYSRAPEDHDRWVTPFALDDLYVAAPGQHPGGKIYWITPRPDVLVATPRKQ
jgi:hypothetical protein